MRDISIDIETLASGSNAAITQIGACYRVTCEPTPSSGTELVTFFAEVLDDTGTYSAKTLQWHREQGGVALPGPDARPIEDVLASFEGWLEIAGSRKEGKALLWTHATFDIPRIAEAYERNGFSRPPWHYRNCRDLRTLYDLAGGRPDLPRVGEHHNALDDAIHQLGEIEACRFALAPQHVRGGDGT